jgi:hypothetical protein
MKNLAMNELYRSFGGGKMNAGTWPTLTRTSQRTKRAIKKITGSAMSFNEIFKRLSRGGGCPWNLKESPVAVKETATQR